MQGFWDDLWREVVKGIVVALVWAGIVWLWLFRKDRLILRSMQRSISASSGAGFERVNQQECKSLVMENSTDWPITIRQVRLKMAGRVPHICKLAYLGKAQREQRGFVVLPPHSEDNWGAPLTPAQLEKVISGTVTIEYKSLLGATKLKEVNLGAEQIRLLKSFPETPSSGTTAATGDASPQKE